MTTALPPPMSELHSPQACIDKFVERFGEAHLRLLCHAAFPLTLTPDLLYRLWGIVLTDEYGANTPIPWTAVSDVMFSGLCEEVGHELYELKPDLRHVLLCRLYDDPCFGAERLTQLARFVLSYSEKLICSADKTQRDFAQVQRWGAIAYLDPGNVALELAQSLTYAYENDAADLNRISGIVQRLSEPLVDYPNLIDYAKGLSRYARGDTNGATNYFKRLLGSKVTLSVEGVKLILPKKLELSQQVSHQEKVSVPLKVRSFSLLLVLVFLGVTGGYIYFWPHGSNPPLPNPLTRLFPSDSPVIAGGGSEIGAQEEKALKKNPKDTEALAKLVELHQEQEQYELAIGYLEQLIALKPDDMNLYFQKAGLYAITGRKDKEEEAYDEILAIKGDNVMALTNKAILRSTRGDLDTARTLFTKAEASVPEGELKKTIQDVAKDWLNSSPP